MPIKLNQLANNDNENDKLT